MDFIQRSPQAKLRLTLIRSKPLINGYTPPNDLGQDFGLEEKQVDITPVPTCCGFNLKIILPPQSPPQRLDFTLTSEEQFDGPLFVHSSPFGPSVLRIGGKEVVLPIGEPIYVGLGIGDCGQDGGSLWWPDIETSKMGNRIWTLWLPGLVCDCDFPSSKPDLFSMSRLKSKHVKALQRDLLTVDLMEPPVEESDETLQFPPDIVDNLGPPRNSVCIVDNHSGRVLSVLVQDVPMRNEPSAASTTPAGQPLAQQVDSIVQGIYPDPAPTAQPTEPTPSPNKTSFVQKARKAGRGMCPDVLTDSLRLSLRRYGENFDLVKSLGKLDAAMGLGRGSLDPKKAPATPVEPTEDIIESVPFPTSTTIWDLIEDSPATETGSAKFNSGGITLSFYESGDVVEALPVSDGDNNMNPLAPLALWSRVLGFSGWIFNSTFWALSGQWLWR